MKSKKFKEDSEMSQPSAGQPAFTSGRKHDQIEETSAGATGSGSIASVASPIGKMQSRSKAGSSIFSGISTSEKFPNSKAVKEGQLSEEDIILMPGQGRRLKPGLMSKRHDNEVEMARNDLNQTEKDAKHVCDMLRSVSEMQGLDGWVQAKITKAADYLSSVRKYLEGKTTQVSGDIEEGAWDSIKGTFSNLGYSDAAEYGRALAASSKQAEQPKATDTKASPIKSDRPDQFKKQTANENSSGNHEGMVEAQSDYQKRRQRERDVDAGKPVKPEPKNPQNDYFARRKKEKDLEEGWKSKLAGAAVTAGIDAYAKSQAKKKQAKQNDPNDQSVKETSEKMTPREKFNRGLKRQGFDPDAAASRLEKLIAKQKQEREEFEKAMPDVYGKKEVDEQIDVPQGFQSTTQPDGSTRISKIGSIPSAEYKQNMAAYKAQNWTPEKIADYGQRMASGQGYTSAEKAANYQQQQQYLGKYADDAVIQQQGIDEEKQGLWANIHAKRERIQHGSGERMRKPGSKGAPTAAALKKSAK